ncbi:hypothetical protein IWW39_006466, partial [Coemansia spiralis]
MVRYNKSALGSKNNSHLFKSVDKAIEEVIQFSTFNTPDDDEPTKDDMNTLED